MPIELTCSNCQTVMRVAEEHAGKNVKCPTCKTVVPIPAVGGSAEDYSQPFDQPTQDFSAQPSSNPGVPNNPAPNNPYVGSGNPFASPTSSGHQGLPNHRGPLILVLGILGFVCCPIFGIPAILMANEDIAKMDRGQMNPEGRGLTVAGKIVAIVCLVLALFGFAAQMLLVVIAAAAA